MRWNALKYRCHYHSSPRFHPFGHNKALPPSQILGYDNRNFISVKQDSGNSFQDQANDFVMTGFSRRETAVVPGNSLSPCLGGMPRKIRSFGHPLIKSTYLIAFLPFQYFIRQVQGVVARRIKRSVAGGQLYVKRRNPK